MFFFAQQGEQQEYYLQDGDLYEVRDFDNFLVERPRELDLQHLTQ